MLNNQNNSAYNHRDVITLTPLSKWDTKTEKVNLQHNRILRPGFMVRNAEEVINDAKAIGEEWLTDVCCPTFEAAMMMHVATELVVKYQVSEDDYEKECHNAINEINKNNKEEIKTAQNKLKEELKSLEQPGKALHPDIVRKAAEERIKSTNDYRKEKPATNRSK